MTRLNTSTAAAACSLAAWLPATSITLPAASRIPLRPGRAAEVKAIISSRRALKASVRMSSSWVKLVVLNRSSIPGSTPPPSGPEVCANLASCMACRIFSADHLPLPAAAATSRMTASSNGSLPRAMALAMSSLPVTPLSKMSWGRRLRGMAFSATGPRTLMLRWASWVGSMPMSRMILAASQGVPMPSAMFSMAPMARACSALGASISQVRMFCRPER